MMDKELFEHEFNKRYPGGQHSIIMRRVFNVIIAFHSGPTWIDRLLYKYGFKKTLRETKHEHALNILRNMVKDNPRPVFDIRSFLKEERGN